MGILSLHRTESALSQSKEGGPWGPDVVRAAVKRALNHHHHHFAHAAPRGVDDVVAAVARSEGLQITIRDAALPFGAFGRWVRQADGREVFEVAHGLASREWTVAHELGHLMLRHYDGASTPSRRCHAPNMRCEQQAERFASLLTSRIAAARRDPRDSVFL